MLCIFLLIASSYDFKESSQIVKFLPHETTKTVYIEIKDDDRVENTEAFIVEILISTTSYSQGVRYGNPHSVKVYIEDGKRSWLLVCYVATCTYIIPDDKVITTQPPTTATKPTTVTVPPTSSSQCKLDHEMLLYKLIHNCKGANNYVML